MSEEPDEIVEEMFVQLATGVTSTPDTLILEGVTPSTLYFSDRPERVVGHLTTEQFVDDWGLGPNSFESDPPNAVLTFADPEGTLEDVVVELRSPHLDHGNLTYSIDVTRGFAAGCGRGVQPLHRPPRSAAVTRVGVRRASS